MADPRNPGTPASVVGVILAGGLSRRMGGGDKTLLRLGGRPMLARVIARLETQVRQLILSANGDPTRFADFDLTVVADSIEAVGPLGGILAGLQWTQKNTDACWIVTVPSDTPFLPLDLVDRLLASVQAGAEVAVARSQNRSHPTIALWPVTLAEELRRWLHEGKTHAAHRWLETRSAMPVDFEDAGGVDPFLNVNTPADLATAERLAKEIA